MKNKKLPLFTLRTEVVGRKLLDAGIDKETNGNPILKTKRYDCQNNCNGSTINIVNT